jgi:hypothetical protein
VLSRHTNQRVAVSVGLQVALTNEKHGALLSILLI